MRILVISEPAHGSTVQSVFSARGYDTVCLADASAALREYQERGADLVYVRLPLPSAKGRDLLVKLRKVDPKLVIFVIGGDESLTNPPEAFDLGAAQYFAEPLVDHNELLSLAGVALGMRKTDSQLRYLQEKERGTAGPALFGESPRMREVVATIKRLCQRASGAAPTVLVSGETGTGKGVVAKALHYWSSRRARAFVDVNCAAISPLLIESELFGHVRGAFTDAKTARAGHFETADGGTLFLDEIGLLPADMQSKMLTVIEEKRIRRVGASTAPIAVDVQIVAASNRSLRVMAETGLFRSDLYHRLNVVNIELPPLRERGDDRVLLARVLLARLCAEYGCEPMELSQGAIDHINSYAWPGNVRELRNELERIVLLVESKVVSASHFRPVEAPSSDHDRRLTTLGKDLVSGSPLAFETLTSQLGPANGLPSLKVSTSATGLNVSLPDESFSLDDLERAVMEAALQKHGFNVSRAAKYLGVSRHTLIYRIKKHQIKAPELLS